ncbi:MAG TPA: DUF5615 family PIN-like protein [Tepidisphaeraceae bacterium]|nr:DUF5615 family PIN-like protein [Tepidisphaeraceae bacterium]
MNFHLDENVSEAIALGLRRRGHDVTTTPQAALISASDQQQLAYCIREGRVLISHDSDMLRLAASGADHSGIGYCHHRKYKTGQLLAKLLLLASRISQQEMKNRVEFL